MSDKNISWSEEELGLTVVEAVPGTLVATSTEVPNSKGAIGVILTEIFHMSSDPDTGPGADDTSLVMTAILAGKRSPTTVFPNEPGYVHGYRQQRSTGAAGVIAVEHQTPPLWQGKQDVPKEPSDKLFYVTQAVWSDGCTNVKGAMAHVKFLVARSKSQQPIRYQ